LVGPVESCSLRDIATSARLLTEAARVVGKETDLGLA
jgi:hypothetical protein